MWSGCSSLWEGQPLSGLRWQAGRAREAVPLGQEVAGTMGREKLRQRRSMPTVPQTDTGRRVENTKANGRTSAKELGKMDP